MQALRSATKWPGTRLVALYQPLVRYWCGRAGVPASEVDDLIQEVFAAVTRSIAEFRRDRPGEEHLPGLAEGRHEKSGSPLLPAESGSITRRGRGEMAYRRLQEFPAKSLDVPDEEQLEFDRLYRQAIEQVRCEFEEASWQAFWLSAVERRQTAALVEELGMSAAAIRQAKSRVLRRIKEELGELLA